MFSHELVNWHVRRKLAVCVEALERGGSKTAVAWLRLKLESVFQNS